MLKMLAKKNPGLLGIILGVITLFLALSTAMIIEKNILGGIIWYAVGFCIFLRMLNVLMPKER